jgi:hypothetical protein
VGRKEAHTLTSDNLSAADAPEWMVELANALRMFPHELPTGVIVGSARIEKCVRVGSGQLPVASGREVAGDQLPVARARRHSLATKKPTERIRNASTPRPKPVP